jgi:hypothetical protein
LVDFGKPQFFYPVSQHLIQAIVGALVIVEQQPRQELLSGPQAE